MIKFSHIIVVFLLSHESLFDELFTELILSHRAIFTLSDTGDIFWKLADETAETPFFAANFDLYEVTKDLHYM